MLFFIIVDVIDWISSHTASNSVSNRGTHNIEIHGNGSINSDITNGSINSNITNSSINGSSTDSGNNNDANNRNNKCNRIAIWLFMSSTKKDAGGACSVAQFQTRKQMA